MASMKRGQHSAIFIRLALALALWCMAAEHLASAMRRSGKGKDLQQLAGEEQSRGSGSRPSVEQTAAGLGRSLNLGEGVNSPAPQRGDGSSQTRDGRSLSRSGRSRSGSRSRSASRSRSRSGGRSQSADELREQKRGSRTLRPESHSEPAPERSEKAPSRSRSRSRSLSRSRSRSSSGGSRSLSGGRSNASRGSRSGSGSGSRSTHGSRRSLSSNSTGSNSSGSHRSERRGTHKSGGDKKSGGHHKKRGSSGHSKTETSESRPKHRSSHRSTHRTLGKGKSVGQSSQAGHPDSFTVEGHQYRIVQELAEYNAYTKATVYLVEDKNGDRFALKTACAGQELAALRACKRKCPNVVQLVASDATQSICVMELGNTTLIEAAMQEPEFFGLPKQKVRDTLRAAVDQLHHEGFAHGDVSNNTNAMFFKRHGQFVLKLIDLGKAQPATPQTRAADLEMLEQMYRGTALSEDD